MVIILENDIDLLQMKELATLLKIRTTIGSQQMKITPDSVSGVIVTGSTTHIIFSHQTRLHSQAK